MFENNWKSRIWIFQFGIFHQLLFYKKSGNTIWPQAPDFQNSPNWTIFCIFYELLSTQNENDARFARNVECDILGDFHTLWVPFFLFSVSRNFSIRFLRDVNQCDSWTWQESIKSDEMRSVFFLSGTAKMLSTPNNRVFLGQHPVFCCSNFSYKSLMHFRVVVKETKVANKVKIDICSMHFLIRKRRLRIAHFSFIIHVQSAMYSKDSGNIKAIAPHLGFSNCCSNFSQQQSSIVSEHTSL